MENFNVEELKTAAGHLMLDLRGNWAYDYMSRLEELSLLLGTLISKDPENKSIYKSDMEITEYEIGNPSDGRVFRDQCKLYGYSSESGRTTRVREYLDEILTYPEYNQIKVSQS